MSQVKKPVGLSSEILRLAGVLFLITALVAGALGVVNGMTEQRIADIQAEQVAAAMRAIVPVASEFVPVDGFTPDDTILALYDAKDASGNAVGLCVQVAPQGFSGPVYMIVGIDAAGAILGVEITSLTETPGLGSNADNADWLAQYQGLSGPLTVVKNAKTGDNDIVALSAATVTSNAVTLGAQMALDLAQEYLGGAN